MRRRGYDVSAAAVGAAEIPDYEIQRASATVRST